MLNTLQLKTKGCFFWAGWSEATFHCIYIFIWDVVWRRFWQGSENLNAVLKSYLRALICVNVVLA